MPTPTTDLHHASNPGSTSGFAAVPPHLNATLPTANTTRQIAEARTALVASIGNMLDRELQGRAAMLHANATAIAKQEREVQRSTEALRRENDKLAKVATDAAKQVKELGNVQNWAEVLERDFLVLQETLRLVREGSEDSGSWSGTGSQRSWGGSEDGDGDGDQEMRDDRRSLDIGLVPEEREVSAKDAEGDAHMGEGPSSEHCEDGKGKASELTVPPGESMQVDVTKDTAQDRAPPDAHLPPLQEDSGQAQEIEHRQVQEGPLTGFTGTA
jgi:hypothetical protein